jgi:hypothetical protein
MSGLFGNVDLCVVVDVDGCFDVVNLGKAATF